MRLTRVYNNGERVTKHAKCGIGWKEYNMTFRPGCALFMDGACVHRGYLSVERCDQIAADERKAIADEDTDRLPPPTPEGEQLLRKLFDDH